MKQRINLLPPRPKVERDYLRFNYVLGAFLGVVLLCSVISGWVWINVNQADEQSQGYAIQMQQQQQSLKKLEVLQSRREPFKALEDYRDKLQKTILFKQRLSGLLETVLPEHRQGFSEGLLAFSNSTPDKVWLTAFKMTTGSLILDLTGESADTSQIPVFLRQLAQQSFFNQMHFAELKTEKKNDQAYLFNAHGVNAGEAHD